MKTVISLIAILLAAVLHGAVAPPRFALPMPPAAGMTEAAAGTALDAIRDTGATWVRIRADWPRIQPVSTSWDFAWLDAEIRQAGERNLDVVLVLGPTPCWAVAGMRNPTEKEAQRARPEWAAYAAYVTKLARRYANRVTYYQLWEQPHSRALLVSAREIITLYRTGAAALHAVNPALRVLAAEPGDLDLGWINTYWQAAAENERPDILLLCPGAYTSTPETFTHRVSVLHERIFADAEGPQLGMEITPDNRALAVTALSRRVPYLFFLPKTPIEDDPDTARMLQQLSVLQQDTPVGWGRLTPTLCGLLLAGDGQSVILALPEVAETLALAPSAQPMEGALAVEDGALEVISLAAPPSPALRLSVSRAAVITLRADVPVLLRGKLHAVPAPPPPSSLLPVPGDRVTLDPSGQRQDAILPLPDFPNGEYQREFFQERPVLKTVRDSAEWIHLDVPDGFLFYNAERTPIEVTLQVVGVQRAQKTGFSLYYDAVAGMTHSPWQWIDVGPDKVFTYSLILTDALFANRQGYDLRVEMGGSVESIRLLNCTVRKMPCSPVEKRR